jgi:hypothetical protein
MTLAHLNDMRGVRWLWVSVVLALVTGLFAGGWVAAHFDPVAVNAWLH